MTESVRWRRLAAVVAVLTAGPSAAQNSDLGFLFGVVQRGAEIRNGIVQGDTMGNLHDQLCLAVP